MPGAHAHRPPRMLVAYDGSADAGAAIELAAATFPGARATVLSVWEPIVTGAARGPSANLDERAEEATRQMACAAAERARALGLDATPRWQIGAAHVWEAILDVAAYDDADLIVLGRGGLPGLRSRLGGSVSENVVRHARGPVLVVPSAGTAGRHRTRLNAAAQHHQGAPATELQRHRNGRPHVSSSASGGLRTQVVPLEDV